MKKLNANEMRKVDGSFWILAGIAVVAGTAKRLELDMNTQDMESATHIRRAAGHANTDGNRHHTLRFAK